MKFFPKVQLAMFCIFGTVAVFADAGSQPPQVIDQASPVYPCSLRLRGKEGNVLLDFIVDESGRVRDVKVLKATHPDFEAPAVEALLQSTFKPGTVDGKPVDAHMQLPINFSFDDQGANPWSIPSKAPEDTPPEFRYDEPPSPTLASAPVYPYDLLQQNIEGSAAIFFVVDPAGHPRRITVADASRPEFGAAAAATIAAWQFEPAKKDGKTCWAMLKIKQDFDRDGPDTPVNESAKRLLKSLKETPCPVLKNMAELDVRLRPRYQPAPIIPEALAKAGTPAKASIGFIIDHAGHAQLPRILSATRDDFGWAAALAVSRWQFTIPSKNGEPVDVFAIAPIVYKPNPANVTAKSAPAKLN